MAGWRHWLALGMLALAAAPAAASLHAVRGEARVIDGGRLLYREEHLVREEGGVPAARLVLYRCPSGPAFARKTVDYRDSATAPAFSLVDARDGYREGLRRRHGRIEVWSGRGTPAPAALEPVEAPLVADAGFDEFLQRHWDALLAGQAPAFAFVVPVRGRALGFEVEHLGAERIEGVPVERFRLRLDGLLGLVGPNLVVAYTADDHRLRRFKGLTNLRDDAGEPLQARIDFAGPPHAVDDDAWQAALDEPLVDCTLGR